MNFLLVLEADTQQRMPPSHVSIPDLHGLAWKLRWSK